MSDIMHALEQACVKNAVKIKLNHNYRIEEDSIIKIFCTRAHDTAEIVKLQFPMLANQLNTINYLDVLAVTADCSKKSKNKSGFGCVIAKNENINCLGVLFNSDIF